MRWPQVEPVAVGGHCDVFWEEELLASRKGVMPRAERSTLWPPCWMWSYSGWCVLVVGWFSLLVEMCLQLGAGPLPLAGSPRAVLVFPRSVQRGRVPPGGREAVQLLQLLPP